MRRFSFVLCAGLLAFPAYAQNAGSVQRFRVSGESHCISMAKAQKAVGKNTTITPMTRVQFAFLQGLYVGLPSTPDGLPPGDGAVILTRDKADDGIIIWTRGPLACEPMPVAKVAKLMKLLAEVKSGVTADGDPM